MTAIQWVDGPLTLTAAAALSRYQLVTVNASGQAAVCGASDVPIGVARVATASGSKVGIIPLNKEGTIPVIANDSFAVGATLNLAADGEVTDGAGTAVGIAMAAAAAAGDIVEMYAT